MKTTAYLSGGMEYAANLGADWRSELESWLHDELDQECFNPVKASETFLGGQYPDVDFRATKKNNIMVHREISRKIVELDTREIIMRTSYVICYYDESAQRGAGTKGELTIASVFGKPVYLVPDMPIDKIPSWVIGCADEIFRDFKSLKEFLSRKFGK